MKPPIGHHITADLFDCQCPSELLEELKHGAKLVAACKEYLHPFGELLHQFKPSGWTAVVGLEESHFTIHTWPQHKFVACDFYTCNGEFPTACVQVVLANFQPAAQLIRTIIRGTQDHHDVNISASVLAAPSMGTLSPSQLRENRGQVRGV